MNNKLLEILKSVERGHMTATAAHEKILSLDVCSFHEEDHYVSTSRGIPLEDKSAFVDILLRILIQNNDSVIKLNLPFLFVKDFIERTNTLPPLSLNLLNPKESNRVNSMVLKAVNENQTGTIIDRITHDGIIINVIID